MALFLATFNLPRATLNSDLAKTAADALLGTPTIATIEPDITPSTAIALMDFVEPAAMLDLADGAALLAAANAANIDEGVVTEGIEALLGTSVVSRLLIRLPGEDLPVDSSDLEFIDLPARVALSRGRSIPGEVSLTMQPNLSPVTQVFVEFKPDNTSLDTFTNEIPAVELIADFDCDPAETQCVVPANEALDIFGEGVVPSVGQYTLTVSIRDAFERELDVESQGIEVTLF